ncbi:ATP-binding cassette domain-containing protein [Bartonella rattimassiliensis]|uniref:ATP-binding cassette domain-containing protein n=1 Tax=Bartonella rattimassiliensis TaxID=270250 RepID=UPI00244E1E8F|nr:ATP-binding cassette domain-containing protein [Bartonella rattimassiliensis]
MGDILNTPSEKEKPLLQLTTKPYLKAKDICFSYGDKAIINHLDICLQPGKPIILLGPLGCGKLTFAKLLCALYLPSNGKILLNNQSLQNFDIRSVRKTIAYFPQNPCLFSEPFLKIYFLPNQMLLKMKSTLHCMRVLVMI